jgi:putative spermidine/putrescine transport system permease protein
MPRFLAAPLLWLEQNPARVLLLPVGFLILFYVLPLLGVMLVSVFPGGEFSFEAYEKLFQNGAFFSVILRTIRLSLIVSIICLILGYPYAYLLTKVGDGTRRILILAVMLPFFTSILIRSYAWVAILGARGPVNKLLVQSGLIDSPMQLVYNEIGALIGMSQIQLPLMILTLYGAMRRIDPDLMRAAEGLGAHRLVALLKVFLPLTWPGVLSGLGLVFTSTLGFYVTPAMLGGPSEYMVTQSINVQLSSLGDFSGAAAQATVLLLIVLVLLYLLRHVFAALGGNPEDNDSGSVDRHRPAGSTLSTIPEAIVRSLGRGADWLYIGLRTLLYLVVLLTVVFLTVTMVAVIPLGFSSDSFLRLPPSGYSLRWVQAYLGDDQWLESTYFSIWISICGAIVATVLASIAAYAMTRWESRRAKPAVEIFLISPMIVPNFVVALALYFIFIKLGLIGSYITYVLAYGVFAFPVVFLVMYAAFQRFDFSLIQAGANLGAAPLSIWRRIVVPILLPSFLSAAVFAFLTAFDDLIVALFFSTAGKYTLPMRMWADIRNEISPQIAAVAVIFFALALAASAVFALGRFLRRRRSNHPLPAAVQSPS